MFSGVLLDFELDAFHQALVLSMATKYLVFVFFCRSCLVQFQTASGPALGLLRRFGQWEMLRRPAPQPAVAAAAVFFAPERHLKGL